MLKDVNILKKIKIKNSGNDDPEIYFCEIINNETGEKIAKSIDSHFPIFSNCGLHIIAETLFMYDTRPVIKNKFIIDDDGNKLANVDDYDIRFGFDLDGENYGTDKDGNLVIIINTKRKNDILNEINNERFIFINLGKKYTRFYRFYGCYYSTLLGEISNIFIGRRKDENGNEVVDILDKRGKPIFEDIYSNEEDKYKSFIKDELSACNYVEDYGCTLFEFIDEKLLKNRDTLDSILYHFTLYVKNVLMEKTNYKGEKYNVIPYLEVSLSFMTHILLKKGVDDAINYIIKYTKHSLDLINNTCYCGFFDTPFEWRLNLCSKNFREESELLQLIGTMYCYDGMSYKC